MATHILIVEDNPTNMELMVYLLTAFGYQVEPAVDGSAGLAKARLHPPDLVICDIEMPGLTGLEVIQELRAHPQTRPIPALAVTAYAMVGDRDRILAAGFDGYISKPIDPETFVKEVESFLTVEKRSRQEPETHDLGIMPAPAAKVTSGALVLVVDDTPVNLALVRSTLEPCGYRVITTETVESALKLMRHYTFDLIFSDLHMSQETGLEFLRQVKQSASLRAIPFLLCSSSTTEPLDGIAQKALALGAEKFLARPLTPERLLEEIASCLQASDKKAARERSA